MLAEHEHVSAGAHLHAKSHITEDSFLPLHHWHCLCDVQCTLYMVIMLHNNIHPSVYIDFTASGDVVHSMRIEILRRLPIQMLAELRYTSKSGVRVLLADS